MKKSLEIKSDLRIKRVLLLFLFIYNFGIYILPRSIRSSLIISVILLIYTLIKNPLFLFRWDKRLLKLFGLYFLVGIISALIMLRNFPIDFSFSISILLQCIFILGAYCFVKSSYIGSSVNRLLKDLVIVIFIQSCIILLMVGFPLFGEFIRDISGNSDFIEQTTRLGSSQSFRGNALSGSLFWDLGIQQSLGLMFIAYLVQIDRKHVYYALAYIVIFVSIIITSRSGLIGAFLSFLILFKKSYTSHEINCCRKGKLRFIIYLSCILLVLIFIIDWQQYQQILSFGFEMFINYWENGELRTSSSDSFLEYHLKFPDLQTFLIGDGRFLSPEGGYYAGSDSGYIRDIYYFGIFSFFFYGVIGWMIYKIRVALKNNKELNFLILLMALYFFFIQIKGDLFVQSYQNMNILFLFYFIVTSKHYYENIRNCPSL